MLRGRDRSNILDTAENDDVSKRRISARLAANRIEECVNFDTPAYYFIWGNIRGREGSTRNGVDAIYSGERDGLKTVRDLRVGRWRARP